MNTLIFNSYSDSIPSFRFDVQRIPITQNGIPFYYFYDSLGYVTPDFALPTDADAILSLIDGSRSVMEILAFCSNDITKEQILGYVRFLDEHNVLASPSFQEQAELVELAYEKSTIHRNTTAGISYPDNEEEVNSFLDTAFKEHEKSKPLLSAKALYAPHIDPRVGMSSYVKAFSAISKLTPKRVILLATSHYSGLYGDIYKDCPFILSDKTFEMPNGEVKSNQHYIDAIKNSVEDLSELGLSTNDRAHRVEHSIELHLLFLNHIWKHDYEIVPILVGGLDELLYTKNSYREQQLDAFTSILGELNDEDTFYLISGDLSHIGSKFGDSRPAVKMFNEIKINDQRFLEAGATGKPNKLISLMKEEYDPYRICGFPPLLSFLKTMPELRSKVLSYDIWDERDKESAVSFGSILYS